MEITGRGIGRITPWVGFFGQTEIYGFNKIWFKNWNAWWSKQVMGIFMKNGALSCGYATFGAGDYAGDRVMGVQYRHLTLFKTHMKQPEQVKSTRRLCQM